MKPCARPQTNPWQSAAQVRPSNIPIWRHALFSKVNKRKYLEQDRTSVRQFKSSCIETEIRGAIFGHPHLRRILSLSNRNLYLQTQIVDNE